MAKDLLAVEAESGQQRFERILAQKPLEAIRAILDRTCPDPARQYAAVQTANTFEQLLALLGYKLVRTRQIHVQDSYSRLGREGGIKAVLPYHDIPTQSSFPTLLHFDSTLTTTSKGDAFFDACLGELKLQLSTHE